MKQLTFETEQLAAECAVETISHLIAKKPDSLLCLAAGHSSIPVFDRLVAAVSLGQLDLSQVAFVGLDEWLNLEPYADGSCSYFLKTHLFDRLGTRPEQICLFNGMASDPEEECQRIEAHIQARGGIDYLLLGMGMNGHLALNEPGDSPDKRAHICPLSDITKQVAPKYFPAGMPPLEYGITLGIQDILTARCIHLTIFGEHKKQAAARLLEPETGMDFPASMLRDCAHATVMFDQAAMG